MTELPIRRDSARRHPQLIADLQARSPGALVGAAPLPIVRPGGRVGVG